MKLSKEMYSIVSAVLLIIAFAYIGIGQLLITNEAGVKGNLWLLTGKPRVILNDDVLKMSFTNRVQVVTLVFKDRLAGQAILNEHPRYNVVWDFESGRVIEIRAKSLSGDQDPVGIEHLQLRVGRAFASGSFKERQLISATIDGNAMSPYEFLTDSLVAEKSTFYLYFPLALGNISSELAEHVGTYILRSIMFILLALAGTQIALLLATIRFQPDSVGKYFTDSDTNPAVTVVDQVSNEFAIPLGLMGTITAIWLALEQPSVNFASFSQILGILRFAIFTTVLGLFTKLLCLLRGYITSSATEV